MKTKYVTFLALVCSCGTLWAQWTDNGSNLTTTDNVGIGTASPLQKLDVRGNLMLESGGDPTIYTGTGVAELNRYLRLINSPNAQSASGLKAGGVLVSDSYGYANPGKNDLIVKGNVGIGINIPLSKLHISGTQGSSLEGIVVEGDNPTLRIKDNSGVPSEFIVFGNGQELRIAPSGASFPSQYLTMGATGNIGIGSASSTATKLHISGTQGSSLEGIVVEGDNPTLRIKDNSGVPSEFIVFGNGQELRIAPSGASFPSQYLTIGATGNIGIGTTNADAKLAVKGDIHTQEVRVDLNGAVAPDFVFEPTYNLRSLAETERYIKEHKHLPEIPSAVEMEQNGMELKAMNLKLLQKVEELTLYAIEQQKLIQEMRTELNLLKNK